MSYFSGLKCVKEKANFRLCLIVSLYLLFVLTPMNRHLWGLRPEGGNGYAGIFRRRSPTAAVTQFGDGKIGNQRNSH